METIKDIILSEEQLRSKKNEKWRTYPSDIIPAWLADMDYSVAQEIRDILKETILQSDLGYSMQPSALGIPNIVAERMLNKYNWILDPNKLEFLNDTVQAIYIAITQFTHENDSVIILSPGYPPIYQCLIQLNRKPICARFTLVGDDVLCLDIERLIECFNENVTAMIFCNPHNPTGHVFSLSELLCLAELAEKFNITIISDEIHQDLIYFGQRHIPIASISKEVAKRTITITSANKAFNLAGVGCSVVIFGSEYYQKKFNLFPLRYRGHIGICQLLGLKTAWSQCESWLQVVLRQLENNHNIFFQFIKTKERLKAILPKATYFAWVDCTRLRQHDPAKFFLEKGKIAFSSGIFFGAEFSNFLRINFATSPEILQKICTNIEFALEKLES